jgi:hypothetical protein
MGIRPKGRRSYGGPDMKNLFFPRVAAVAQVVGFASEKVFNLKVNSIGAGAQCARGYIATI